MREESSDPGTASRLPLLGLVVGVWAVIPPYVDTFGALNVEARVEFADHVVPGVLVLAVSVLGLVLLRSARPQPTLLLLGGGAIALAGLWMVATHLPLIGQARNEIVPGGAVVWHGLPGLAVSLLGAAWTVRYWESDTAEEPSSGR